MEAALSKTDGVAILSIFVDIDPEEPNESAGFLVRAGAKVLYVSKKLFPFNRASVKWQETYHTLAARQRL